MSRTRRLKNTHLFKVHAAMVKLMDQDMTHGISLANIKHHLRTLRVKGVPSGPLSEVEALAIFKDIEAYIEGERSAIKFLYMAPLSR